MRNLKRALSLTLASVMLLGMMVVGSSAAEGYSDVTEDNNVEAIEVLQTIKVMVGDERGFGPARPVNRAEMAVVMALLLNLDYDYYVSSCPFGDVYDWARGPVGACYANGIVSGRGDGIYDPGATVTAVEAASMLMRALGYFRYQNDYEGNFVLSTVKQGTKIGLFDGVGSSADTPMTRDQVAKMVLNALQTGMVEPDGNTLNLATPDGNIYTGKVNYVNVTSNKPFATAISSVRASSMGSANDSPIVELGEQLYDGKLKLNSNTTDVFGRPARHWEFDGKAIGTYAKKELLEKEYTTKVTGRDLYDEIGSATLNDKDYDVFIYIDGETEKDVLGTSYFTRNDLNKNNKEGVGATGNGVLTQVFVDGNRKEVTIAVINTYLARAKADYSEKKDNVTFEVYKIDDVKNSKTAPVYVKTAGKTENLTVTSEDFDIKEIKDGDAYRVNIADGEIQVLELAEIIGDSTLTAFSKDNYVISDGTQYDYANAIQYDPEVLEEWTQTVINLKDRKYNLYMDAYGYVLGIDLVEDPDNYVFITGVDSSTSNLSSTNFKANAIFLDGTMDTIEINGKKSTFTASNWEAPLVNRWFTYTVNNNTKIYTVDEINDEINKGTSAVGTVNTKHTSNKLAQFATEDVILNLAAAKANIASAKYDTTTKYDIDVKHVSLPGTGANIETGTKIFNKVYGNDNTVYLTADVETINPDNKTTGNFVGVISGVSNVTTGVKNANIKTYDRDEAMREADKNGKYKTATAVTAAYGAYSLYNKDGYIIASVVVGEDNAAAKNLVYAHTSDVELETYTTADDEWTWTRKVIFNGEETEIKEVGDKLTHLSQMNRYNWYQVKFNSNDEVIGVELADNALTHATAAAGNEYVSDVEWIEDSINEKNTVLYEESAYLGYTTGVNTLKKGALHRWNEVNYAELPWLDGHTFYVRTTDKTGFVVRDDVKSVFIQTRDNKLQTYYGENYDDLKDILDDLNADTVNSLRYHYEVSAILTDGQASVVVIHDLNGDGYTTPVAPTNHKVTASYDGYWTYTITISDNCTPNYPEVANAIKEEMESAKWGAKDVTVTFDNSGITEVTFTTKAGVPMKLNKTSGNLNVGYQNTVNIDGTNYYWDKNGTRTGGACWNAGATQWFHVYGLFTNQLNWGGAPYNTMASTSPYFKVTYQDCAAGTAPYSEYVRYDAKPTQAEYNNLVSIETGYLTSTGLKAGGLAEAVDAVASNVSNTSKSDALVNIRPANPTQIPFSEKVSAGNTSKTGTDEYTIKVRGEHNVDAGKTYCAELWDASKNTSNMIVLATDFDIPAGAKAIKTNNGRLVVLDQATINSGKNIIYWFTAITTDATSGKKVVDTTGTNVTKTVQWYADTAGTMPMGNTITYKLDYSGVEILTAADAVAEVEAQVSGKTASEILARGELTPGGNGVLFSEQVTVGAAEKTAANTYTIKLGGEHNTTGTANAYPTEFGIASATTANYIVVPVSFAIPEGATHIKTNNGVVVALENEELASGEKIVYFMMPVSGTTITNTNKTIQWMNGTDASNNNLGPQISYNVDTSGIKLITSP